MSKMDKGEMRQLASNHLSSYREKTHDELRKLVEDNYVDVIELKGSTGARYQIEVNFHWDDRQNEEIRVDVTIDQDPHRPMFGFLPVYISTIADGFIMKPDGTFIDE